MREVKTIVDKARAARKWRGGVPMSRVTNTIRRWRHCRLWLRPVVVRGRRRPGSNFSQDTDDVIGHAFAVDDQAGQTATATASGLSRTWRAHQCWNRRLDIRLVLIATVTSSGVVTAVAAGQTTIIASAGGRQGSAGLTVQAQNPQAKDFAITDAQFTQGVQVADGSIPMVLSGNAAAVNVLVRSVPASSTSMQIVLRIFDAGGALIRSDTAVTSGTLGPVADL